MHRMSRLFLHLSLGLSVAGFMAAPVLAQDLGTYRPGQAYQSVASPTADVCNSHCAGDAQCNAWNYVKVNPHFFLALQRLCNRPFQLAAKTPVRVASHAAPRKAVRILCV